LARKEKDGKTWLTNFLTVAEFLARETRLDLSGEKR
jgi:hypothetical protein